MADPNPNAQWEIEPAPVPMQSGIKAIEPKSKLLGWATDLLLRGQAKLEDITAKAEEGSQIAGLSYISNLLGIPGMARTADRWNYGMDTGMPTMTRPMTNDATDFVFNAIPLAAGVAKLAAPALRAGASWRPGGTVGMFYTPKTPAEQALERTAIDMELAGASKREISQKTGMSRWPDEHGMLVEMPDHTAPYIALDAVVSRRPVAKKTVENHRAAVQYAALIENGKPPPVAERILRERGVTLTSTAKTMGASNSVRDLQDSLKTVTDQLTGPVSGFKLPEILNHPDLYAKFPELKDINVEFKSPQAMRGNEGYFTADTNTVTLSSKYIKDPRGKEVILHEIQHPIDRMEGRAPGTSVEAVAVQDPGLSPQEAMDVYRTETGEARARVTQNSAHLDEAQRRERPVMEDRLDVPEHSLWHDATSPTPNVSNSIPLGKALEDETHTLKTLERLPMRLSEIPIKTIREQMARPDVSKAEKDILEATIEGGRPEDRISAETLVRSMKAQTKDLQLTPKDSDQWAEYGLDRLGKTTKESELTALDEERAARFMQEGATRDEAYDRMSQMYKPISGMRTTQYELPDGVVGDTGNHFGNPNYFAHTRAFEEGGIPHVIELQSDLAQKAGKTLSSEERTNFEGAVVRTREMKAQLDNSEVRRAYVSDLKWVEKMDRFLTTADEDVLLRFGEQLENLWGSSSPENAINHLKQWMQSQNSGMPQTRQQIHNAMAAAGDRLGLLETELQAKLQAGDSTANVQPMLKNWDRRLVNEEISRASRERAGLPQAIQEAESELAKINNLKPNDLHMMKVGGGTKQLYHVEAKEIFEEQMRVQDEMANLKSKLAAPPVVRFASADTVARVEGWQDNHARLLENIAEAKKRLANPEYANSELSVHDRKNLVGDIEELSNSKRFNPEHQGIYDRYAKETTNYLKSLGGKPVTDGHGHTWIEVPVKSGRTPLFSMSGAAALAGAGAGSYNAAGSED